MNDFQKKYIKVKNYYCTGEKVLMLFFGNKNYMFKMSF